MAPKISICVKFFGLRRAYIALNGQLQRWLSVAFDLGARALIVLGKYLLLYSFRFRPMEKRLVLRCQ